MRYICFSTLFWVFVVLCFCVLAIDFGLTHLWAKFISNKLKSIETIKTACANYRFVQIFWSWTTWVFLKVRKFITTVSLSGICNYCLDCKYYLTINILFELILFAFCISKPCCIANSIVLVLHDFSEWDKICQKNWK